MYEQYLRDPASVPEEWRQLFDNGKLAELPVIPTTRAEVAAETAPAAEAAEATPTHPPSPIHQAGLSPITGPAHRLAQNINVLLCVPAVTPFRASPVSVSR